MVVEYTLEQVAAALPIIMPCLVSLFFIEAIVSLCVSLFVAPKSIGKVIAMWSVTQIILLLCIVLIYTMPDIILYVTNIWGSVFI